MFDQELNNEAAKENIQMSRKELILNIKLDRLNKEIKELEELEELEEFNRAKNKYITRENKFFGRAK